jgi:CelD/BcsL family acetyltransferase involved in cellulose biosynthesis
VITLHEVDDEQAYEAEVSQCVGVTGYHHWFFLNAMAEALNLKFRAIAVDSNGERLGVVPLLFRRRGPVSTVNYLPVGCIGPLLRGEALRAGRVRELVSAVEPVLWRHRTAVTHWAFSPGLRVSAEHLAMRGFEVLESESYVIPAAKSIDDCLKSMSKVRRQSIKQSEAHGLVVTESSIEDITRWLPAQISGAYQRQGALPSYNPAQTRAMTEKLATHPRMLWRTVRGADSRILGVAGCVIGDDRLWGWLMVGPPAPGVSAHSICYWDLINWSLSRGLALDLGGVPSEGVRKFKISMGAEVETCVTAIRTRPGIVYTAGRTLYNWTMIRLAMRQGSSD